MDIPKVEGVEFRSSVRPEGYLVGSDGSIWSSHSINGRFPPGWRKMSIYRRPYGARYLVVSLREDFGRGKVVCCYVHRMVLEAFEGVMPKEMQCLHKNDDTSDARLENLRWGTHRENTVEAMDRDRLMKGAKHTWAKLDDQKVRDIRRLRGCGETFASLGRRFGVSRSSIRQIIAGKTWRHVTHDIAAPPEVTS